MTTQNVYEYKKIQPIQNYEKLRERLGLEAGKPIPDAEKIKFIKNTLDELIKTTNQLAMDFELYKKAYKQHIGEQNEQSNKIK